MARSNACARPTLDTQGAQPLAEPTQAVRRLHLLHQSPLTSRLATRGLAVHGSRTLRSPSPPRSWPVQRVAGSRAPAGAQQMLLDSLGLALG
jgi:hypothetical protein